MKTYTQAYNRQMWLTVAEAVSSLDGVLGVTLLVQTRVAVRAVNTVARATCNNTRVEDITCCVCVCPHIDIEWACIMHQFTELVCVG